MAATGEERAQQFLSCAIEVDDGSVYLQSGTCPCRLEMTQTAAKQVSCQNENLKVVEAQLLWDDTSQAARVTSLISWAPAFSKGSSSSMARAMVTPSLMTCNETFPQAVEQRKAAAAFLVAVCRCSKRLRACWCSSSLSGGFSPATSSCKKQCGWLCRLRQAHLGHTI